MDKCDKNEALDHLKAVAGFIQTAPNDTPEIKLYLDLIGKIKEYILKM